jgi:Ca2+-binding RTX toxin-like protein
MAFLRPNVRATIDTVVPLLALLAVAFLVFITPPFAHAAGDPCTSPSPTVTGTEGADVLNGTEGDDTIAGLGGDDTINGFGGTDVICGGLGNDLVFGGSGSDHISGDPDNDRLDGGDDFDWVYYDRAPFAMRVDLERGVALGWEEDRLSHIEGVVGSAFVDELIGDASDNQLEGGRDFDFLNGLGGDDVLSGGPGLDSMNASAGNDVFIGGLGIDTVWFLFAPRAIRVDLRTGRGRGWGSDAFESIEDVIGSRFSDVLIGSRTADGLSGEGGGDWIYGLGGRDDLDGSSGADRIDGGDGLDRLTGWSGNDIIRGGSGRDFIEGNKGRDQLRGGPDGDRIIGGAGNDRLDGGRGLDRLDGGPAFDRCVNGERRRRCEYPRPPISGTQGGVTVAPQCHPSYPTLCLDPNAFDYDCAGGSGDGPRYVYARNFAVRAPDPFRLDADGDGKGCET